MCLDSLPELFGVGQIVQIVYVRLGDEHWRSGG